MNSDERRQRESERFDESAPDCLADTDWDDWRIIADHLREHQAVVLPHDFSSKVGAAIHRSRFWSEFWLVLQAAAATGFTLTCVIAWTLGFDWWSRLWQWLQPDAISSGLGRLSAAMPDAVSLATVVGKLEPVIRLAPSGFLCCAIVILFVELAVFRFLRLGPFQPKATPTPVSHYSL